MDKNKSLTSLQPHNQEDWQGFTMEELRYRRAYIGARRELEKERLYHRVGSAGDNAKNMVSGTVSRVATAIPVVRYGMMAFTVGSSIFKILGKFWKKKK